MPQFIDRRLNPRDKSLGNRQRFLRRTRAQIKQAVDKAVARAPHRRRRQGGLGLHPDGRHRRAVVPSLELRRRSRNVSSRQQGVRRRGPHRQARGRPAAGGGPRGRGVGDGEDDFTFALSEAEFLDILFEDLELPDLVKATLKDDELR